MTINHDVICLKIQMSADELSSSKIIILYYYNIMYYISIASNATLGNFLERISSIQIQHKPLFELPLDI